MSAISLMRPSSSELSQLGRARSMSRYLDPGFIGFTQACEVLMTMASTFNALTWQQAQDMQSVSIIGQLGNELVSELQGVCDLATSSTDPSNQTAFFPSVECWQRCKSFLFRYVETPIQGWYDPDYRYSGYFGASSSYNGESYWAPELMTLKNGVAAQVNTLNDQLAQLNSQLQLIEQTYNVCIGLVKSTNSLLDDAVKKISRGV